MRKLPAGTLTFLFTDIEGSTKLWEEHPEPMRHALACHDALMRNAIEQNNGYVFKTVGDAFCAAFTTAIDALTAALVAQQELQAQVWPEPIAIRVRMGLHTGVAELRDEDYFGPTVNRASRVQAVGHGGQILLSDATMELCRDSLPQGTTLLSLGEHRLKYLSRPETLYQVQHPTLPTAFAPLNSLNTPGPPNNLPVQLTSFIGRKTEVSHVKALLTKTRLLTLTGSGGCGKTRLSLQVMEELLEDGDKGAWFVELAPLSDPDLVAQSVTVVLGIKEEPNRTILETLTHHLRDKSFLLVLDNCEHLRDACAQFANTLLRHCPHVLLLATSRESLGIGGETTYRVPPLSLPDPRQAQTPKSLAHVESVQLFIERAVQAQPHFAVTHANAPSLAALCLHLDGIPLAIELAAARLRSLSLEEINRRLDQRFRLLTGGNRMALPRQQTLKALIDWSYDLLNELEKALLCRLSVFSGGWTLEAAEQVCASEGIEEWEVLDLLTSLVDKSLLLAEPSGESTRYRLLQTIRQYAKDRLHESGHREIWCRRHLTFFTQFAEEAEPHLRGSEQPTYLDRLEGEHDNLRAALEGSASAPESHTLGLRLAGSLWRFWIIRGYLKEGRARTLKALSLAAHENEEARAKALYGIGSLAWAQGDFVTAQTFLEESLAIQQKVQNRNGAAMSLNGLGNVAWYRGDKPVARRLYEESLEICRELGDQWQTTNVLTNLGMVIWSQGDYATARAILEENVEILRELGDRWRFANVLSNLAMVVHDQGDFPVARAHQEKSLVLLCELGGWGSTLDNLEGLAALAAVEGALSHAARLWGAAERLREEIGSPMPPVMYERYAQQVAAARTATDELVFSSLWAEGRSMTRERAIELALEKGEVG